MQNAHSHLQGYGIHVPGGLHKAPLVETMDPLPEPYRSNVFYYNYQSTLRAASADKPWTWAEIRPDAIVSITITTHFFFLFFLHHPSHPPNPREALE